MAKSNANDIIASLVCEEDEFVLGQDAIWHRPALDAKLSELVLKSSNKSKLDLSEVAKSLGVAPADVRSLEEAGILVADGFVISKPRMIQEVQNLARASMMENGYVEMLEISSQLGLYSSTTLSLIEIALRDVEHVSKQEFQLKAEKERLLKKLEEATAQTVQIPPELRSWAADVCKTNPKLQGGNIINMGSEYEPKTVREERARLLKTRLAEGFALDESETKYLDQVTRSSLSKLYSRYCSSTLLELVEAHVSAEITESGCCSVGEVLSTFQTKLDLEEKDLMEAIKIVLKETSSGLRFVGDLSLLNGSIFRKRDIDAFQLNGDDSFCKSDEGKHVLQSSVLQTKLQQQSVEILDIQSKSKPELESIFSDKLWPEFALYIQGLTKLKRTGQMYSLLTEFLLASELKASICQVLEALLRVDLQLGPNESIPEDQYRTKLKPLVEDCNNNLDKFEKELKSLASLKYGLSCLSLDKKQEKDLISKLREKWTLKQSSNLATWCNLFSLGVLYVFKVAIYFPRSNNNLQCRQLWESSKTVLSFPREFVNWSDDQLQNQQDVGQQDQYDLVSLLDDLDAFLNQCTKIK